MWHAERISDPRDAQYSIVYCQEHAAERLQALEEPEVDTSVQIVMMPGSRILAPNGDRLRWYRQINQTVYVVAPRKEAVRYGRPVYTYNAERTIENGQVVTRVTREVLNSNPMILKGTGEELFCVDHKGNTILKSEANKTYVRLGSDDWEWTHKAYNNRKFIYTSHETDWDDEKFYFTDYLDEKVADGTLVLCNTRYTYPENVVKAIYKRNRSKTNRILSECVYDRDLGEYLCYRFMRKYLTYSSVTPTTQEKQHAEIEAPREAGCDKFEPRAYVSNTQVKARADHWATNLERQGVEYAGDWVAAKTTQAA